MPNLASVSSHGELPNLVISEYTNGSSVFPKPSTSTRPRSNTSPRQTDYCQGRTSASEWIDVEEEPRRRRKRRSISDTNGVKKTPTSQLTAQRSEGSELSRFFPKLSRILETGDGVDSRRSAKEDQPASPRRRRDPVSPLRKRPQDDASPISRRSHRRGTGVSQRQRSSPLPLSPSVLSVLSTMTGLSDKSSRSSSTLTQESYAQKVPPDANNRPVISRRATEPPPDGRLPRYDAYREHHSKRTPPTTNEYDDDASVVSCSTASSYQASDAGSSEGPGTPSSRSTLPSPTSTRRASVSELRKKYDAASATSGGSARNASRSPSASARKLQPPSVSVVVEDEDEDNPDQLESSEVSCSTGCSSSHHNDGSDWRLHQQEAYMHNHMANNQTPAQHYIDPNYGQHRSMSTSSHSSDHAAWALMQQQQQHPSPQQHLQPLTAMPLPSFPVNYVNHLPPAPNPPDLTQRTIGGYEKLALELASKDSAVKPVYRKFEYLHHRVLLHLQDELCELEEELRLLDEIIAQMSPSLGVKEHLPRRAEMRQGSNVHYRREQVLGCICAKTEHYNRAVASYAALCTSSDPAQSKDVTAFRDWLCEHKPLPDIETKFLDRSSDLIRVGKKQTPALGVKATFTGIFTSSNVIIAALLLLCGILTGCLLRS